MQAMNNCTEDKCRFMTAEEVAAILGVSTTSAYRIIKQLNLQLESMGKIVVAGKVSRRYFEEKALY